MEVSWLIPLPFSGVVTTKRNEISIAKSYHCEYSLFIFLHNGLPHNQITLAIVPLPMMDIHMSMGAGWYLPCEVVQIK